MSLVLRALPPQNLDAELCRAGEVGSNITLDAQVDDAHSIGYEDGGPTSLVVAFLLAPGPRFWAKPTRFPENPLVRWPDAEGAGVPGVGAFEVVEEFSQGAVCGLDEDGLVVDGATFRF